MVAIEDGNGERQTRDEGDKQGESKVIPVRQRGYSFSRAELSECGQPRRDDHDSAEEHGGRGVAQEGEAEEESRSQRGTAGRFAQMGNPGEDGGVEEGLGQMGREEPGGVARRNKAGSVLGQEE